MENVPIVAWQQAVIVVLFAFFVAWLAAFFGKQSDKWQKFMFDIDERWRGFNKEQREENNCAMADVNASLSNLTKTTSDLARSVSELRRDIEQHDAQAKEILALVANGAPKPKAKKVTDAE
jgi:hypothetical protein